MKSALPTVEASRPPDVFAIRRRNRMLRRFLLIIVIGLAAVATACQPDTTSEKIAENIEDTGDEIADVADDMRDEVENACEEAKQAADAADTDC